MYGTVRAFFDYYVTDFDVKGGGSRRNRYKEDGT